jgi:hypothetical protein
MCEKEVPISIFTRSPLSPSKRFGALVKKKPLLFPKALFWLTKSLFLIRSSHALMNESGLQTDLKMAWASDVGDLRGK